MRDFWRGQRGEVQLTQEAIGGMVWFWIALVIVVALAFGGKVTAEVRSHIAYSSSVQALSDRLHQECKSALSCRAPSTDIFGNSNSDGHEIGFFTRTICSCGPLGKGEDLFWVYYYNSTAHTIQEYTSQWSGSAFTTWTPKGAPWTNITSADFINVLATTRANSSSPYYLPPVAQISGLADLTCSYGFTDYPGWNGTVDYTIQAGTNGKDGSVHSAVGQPNIYCLRGRTYIVAYFSPTPSPAPTPVALPAVWPAAVELAAPGTTLASASTPRNVAVRRWRFDFGAAFNALLGGAIASAQVGPLIRCTLDCPKVTPTPLSTPTPTPTPVLATPVPTMAPTPVPTATPSGGQCTAYAYSDANMTQRLPPGTKDPSGAVVVDANGCYMQGSSARIWVSETNYSGAFLDGANSCAPFVQEGTWYPTSAQGPTAAQTLTVASGASSGMCSVTFQDQSGASVSANVAIVAQCGSGTLANGYSCTFIQGWPGTDWVACDGDGSTYYSPGTDGTDHTGTVTVDPSSTGNGTITYNGNGNYTFTRSSPGTVVLDMNETWFTNVSGRTVSGYPFCKGYTTGSRLIGTITIN